MRDPCDLPVNQNCSGPDAQAAAIYELPSSSVQRRLWFLEEFEGGGQVYNTPVAYRLLGSPDVDALERSLNEIVRRHEVLRTAFARDGDTIVQRIAPELRISLPVVDVSACADPEDAARRLVNEDAGRRFNLAKAPLFRCTLFRIRPDDHILSMTSHHIVFDGWSEGVLVAELDALYDAFRQGHAPVLPEPVIQYADYAVWQEDRLGEPDMERQLAYWTQQLASVGPVDLPIGRPRPKVQTHHGAIRVLDLPAPLVEGIKSVGLQEQATLFMTLAAAFDVLLYRYTGQTDLALGFIVSGRDRSELEALLGCFVNTLVLRADVSGDPTFREVLRRVRQAAVAAYANQDLPFDRLAERLGERDLSRNSLFQILFNQEPAPTQGRVGDLVAKRVLVDPGVSKFDISVAFRFDEHTGAVTGAVEYSTGLFDGESIDRLVGHYMTLLDGISANPDARVSALPLLTTAEHERQIAWNATTATYPSSAVHELIAEQARRTPDRIAVEFEDRQLTYRALDEQADLVARRLRARGVAAGVRVGIFLDRSPNLIVGVLGALKAGAAYVPLDPAFPVGRLAYMVSDSGVALVLTERAIAAALPPTGASVVMMDDDHVPPDIAPAPEMSLDEVAYVIYTSGSTGRPKGVAVTHRSLVNVLESMGREPGVDMNDVLLSVTTLSFDIAALELYLPLMKGARIVLTSREDASSGRQLSTRLDESNATVMQATPATWRLLIEAGWEGTPGLRVLCGGEALSRDLADELLARADEVWNVYGPTETTIWSSVCRITGDEGPIAIGRPIANTQMWVLDGNRTPLPVGLPGELYIGGVGVAQGYWEQPELTKARFIPDPFSPTPGARLYRTGDLARWLPDGRLECLGRLDSQIKLRGFRIELEEIEAAIARHAGVRDVVVTVREETPEDKRLIAYLVADGARSSLIDEVRGLLRASLPQYMVPSAFLVLPRLPRTPNGKIDRAALPVPGAVTEAPPEAAVPPRTASEQLVFDAFSDVLGRCDFGVLENFFDLGGHSLMAARLTSRLQAATDLDVPLRSLFEHPTAAGLADLIDSWSWLARSKTELPDSGSREEVQL